MSHSVIDGQFVSDRIQQIVLAIKDYSPDIEVQWVPPAARTGREAAFRVMHCPEGGAPYVIFHVQTEEEFDARVLKRIIAGDQRNGEVKYSELEAAEEAAKRIAHQRFLDSLEEANEIAQAVLKSKKSSYKVNNDLTIRDDMPGNHAKKPKYL